MIVSSASDSTVGRGPRSLFTCSTYTREKKIPEQNVMPYDLNSRELTNGKLLYSVNGIMGGMWFAV